MSPAHSTPPNAHHTHGTYYPPVPSASEAFSPHHHQPPAPGHLQAELPQLAPNPWVKDLISWFAKNTVGVARVDLRRPTAPLPEQYGNNLLFANYKRTTTHTITSSNNNNSIIQWRPFRRGGKGRPASPARTRGLPPPPPPPQQYYPQQAYPTAPQGYPNPPPGYPTAHPHHTAYPPPPSVTSRGAYPAVPQPPPPQYTQYETKEHVYQEPSAPELPPITPSGARVKITRRFLLWRNEEDDKSMIDIGGGINIDMDRQKVQPVLRMKLGQVLSIKAYPTPCLKLAKLLPLGNTGMGLKIHYEVPLSQAHHFYRPPARLMVRLDPMPGSGVKLSPVGLELDQQTVKFGKNMTLRASAGLVFPRSIPFDPESDDVGLKVHRLSLKALW